MLTHRLAQGILHDIVDGVGTDAVRVFRVVLVVSKGFLAAVKLLQSPTPGGDPEDVGVVAIA